MDYRDLLKKYMANVADVSGQMTYELFGTDAGGDFLGGNAAANFTPEEFQLLCKISDELVAEGKI